MTAALTTRKPKARDISMKKTGSFYLLSMALIIISFWLPQSTGAETDHITKEDLNAKLCSPNLVLLDVRTGDVWEKSKIKIECSRRVAPKNVESWVATIPKDKEIVLYDCS